MAQSIVKSIGGRQVFFGVLVFICGLTVASGQTRQTMLDGQTIDVDGLFTFRLPAGWSKRSAFNVVEVRGEWFKGKTKLAYVWGKTESGDYGERRQSWMNDYEETTTRIGGRRANIRSFSRVVDGKRVYYAELNVGNWDNGEVQINMKMEGSEPTVIDLAKQIFGSVTLPLPPPERSTPR